MKKLALTLVLIALPMIAEAKIYKFAGCWYSQSSNQNDGKPMLLYCSKATALAKSASGSDSGGDIFDINKVPLKLREFVK